MRPFDLERFLAGDPVVCRDGTVPTEVHYFASISNGEEKIVAVVDGMALWVCDDGRQYRHVNSESDLMMAPRTVEKWVWVSGAVISKLFDTKEECSAFFGTSRGHPARVTWEE